MKFLLPIILSVCLLEGCATTSSSGNCCAGGSATKVTVAGDYTGHWDGSDGGSGKLKLALQPVAGAGWSAKASFTYQGEEVPATTKSVEVNGPRVQLSYAYEVQGTAGVVTMLGSLSGDTIEGTYQVEGANGGTWTASRKP